MKIGYVRGNGHEEIRRQIEALKIYGCDNIFSDCKPSSSNDFTFLHRCISEMERGNTLIVESVINISKGMQDLVSILRIMYEKGVRIVIINDFIQTISPLGRAVIEILIGAIEYDKNHDYMANKNNDEIKIIKRGIKRIDEIFERYKEDEEKWECFHIDMVNK